jgi:ribosomal protein S18 acetylase RimI-like enzyme
MIRQLDQNDSREYYEIRLKGLQLHPEAFGTGAEDWSKATNEQVRSLLENSSPDDFVLGAFQSNKLAGVIGLKREKKHSVGHKGTIWGLVVLPEFRNQGIGNALVKALIEKVSSNKEIKYVRALVTITELNAIPIFESNGFKNYGLELRGIKEGENYYNQSYMMFDIQK